MKKFCIVLAVFFICPLFGCGCHNEKKTTYKITCSLSDNILCGKEKVNFYNFTDNSFKELKFNLFGNAFRENAVYSPITIQYERQAYFAGKNYGEMKILGVKSNDKDLEYFIGGEDENILIVKTDREVFPGEEYSVNIDYELKLANVISRTGINKKTINLGNFYPVLCGIENGAFYECIYYPNGDPFFSDCADYDVTLSCDKELVVASSGKLYGVKEEESKKILSYKINNARAFAFVVSKNFESVSDTFKGKEVTYYYYNDENPASAMKSIIDSLKFFTEMFGEYHYDTYSVVQTEFIEGGMEYPALVYISSNLTQEEKKEVIVHETAHQWWQVGVGNNEIEYGFLDEGLAEYSVVLFYEKNKDYGLTREEMMKSAESSYKLFCSVYDKIYKRVDTSMLKSLPEFTSEYEYVNIAYIKPCIMFDVLRQTIGDEKFFRSLKSYYNDYCFKIAYPYNLVAEFEKNGKDVEGFFNGFFEGKTIL